MDMQQMRDLVAKEVSVKHGNQEFIRQMQAGEQDDGPWMEGADIVRRWFLEQMMPEPEGVEE
jgi:hypothetical protein